MLKKIFTLQLFFFFLAASSELEEAFSPFLYAATTNNIPMLEAYVARNHPINESIGGNTALHLAAYYNQAKAIEFLVSHNAELELTNEQGQTALWVAASLENIAAMRVLLQQGANFLQEKNEISLLDHIQSHKKFNILQECINYGHWCAAENFYEYLTLFTKKPSTLKTVVIQHLYNTNKIDQLIELINKQNLEDLRQELLYFSTRFVPFNEKIELAKKIGLDENKEPTSSFLMALGDHQSTYYIEKWKHVLSEATKTHVSFDKSVIQKNIIASFRLLILPQSTIK